MPRAVSRYEARRPARIKARAQAKPMDRVPGLDLLRLAAALSVVMFHLGWRGTAGQDLSHTAFPEIAALARYGFAGVDLFFVISGFVIAASAEGRTTLQFALARFTRLYPAHVACMTVTALVVALLGTSPHHASLAQWLANLTMLSPAFGQPFMDGAYWSIVLEIVFYGWVGLGLATGLLERRLLAVIATWLAICLLNSTVLHAKALNVVLLAEYGPYFASGILMHRLWRGDRRWQVKALLAIAALIGLAHAYGIRAEFSRLYQTDIDVGVLWMVHVSIYALFAAALLASRYVPSTPLIMALGGVTYPLYLVHQNAGYIVLDRLAPAVGRWPALFLTLTLVGFIAWLVWRHVEPRGRAIIRAVTTAAGSIVAGSESTVVARA